MGTQYTLRVEFKVQNVYYLNSKNVVTKTIC